MAKSIIGKVAITPKGDYSNTTQYKKLDVVTFEGSSYVCLKDSRGIAVTNTEYWQLMAKHGEFTAQQLEDFKDAVVEDSKDEMDTYTNTKKTELDTYVEDYEDDLKSSLDSYETTKETELNSVTDDNISAINRNAENKITEFNTNATNKTNDFNNNATQKTTDFDTNATDKTTEYNTNATSKVNEYNTNANNKIAEYDAHVAELQEQIDELKETVDSELDTVEVEGTSIDVSNSARGNYGINVKANTHQNRLTGKNHFNVNDDSVNLYACSINISNNTLIQKNDGSYCRSTWKLSNLVVGNQYTIKLIYNNNNNNSLRISIFDSTNTNEDAHSSTVTDSTGELLLTFNATESQKYCRIYSNTKSTQNYDSVEFSKIQIEEGPNATDYESYCGEQVSPNINYPQDIRVVTGDNVIKHVGKNKLNIVTPTTSQGITSTKNSDGSVRMAGTTKTTWFNIIDSVNEAPICIKKGRQFIFSINTNFNFIIRLRLYEKDSQNYKNINIPIGQTSVSFTAEADYDKYFIFAYDGQAGTAIDTTLKFQLEEGSTPTPTPYEQYRGEEYELNLGNIELCKIGNYEDILFKNEVGNTNYNSSLVEGAWYKKNVVGKVVLDGSESGWSVANTGTDNYYYRWTYRTRVITGMTLFNYYVNAMITNSNVEQGAYLTNITSENSQLRIRYGTEDTLENYNSWLSTHNLIVYHAFETPTYTKITDTTLISQLEALKKAKWYKGTNHWWTETENLEPILKTAYKQSNNLRIQALEQAVVSLGGV